jgi:phosphate-selective porin OprO and OprP
VGTVPAFVSASVPNATDVQLFGFESSWNLGSVNFQAEYIGSYIDRLGQDPVLFHGTYVQASYFLTGESRQWDRKLGFFGRAQVDEPFFRVRTKDGCTCTSRGAWELVTRWNYLDLSDRDVNGGYMDGATFGLNWYLNSYMRMMFNYSIHDVHDFTAGRSDANTFGYRLDVHF